ncbi:MAG TPA: hypothetical protein VI752_01390 [Candidatus Paceibacterota bacterium]
MDEKYKKQYFSVAIFWVGLYYLRWSVLFAVEYRGLSPDYLRAFTYLLITMVSFYFFSKRDKFFEKKWVFWVYIIWGIFTFVHFINVILPNYY